MAAIGMTAAAWRDAGAVGAAGDSTVPSSGQGMSSDQKLQADYGRVGSGVGLAEGFRYFGPTDLTGRPIIRPNPNGWTRPTSRIFCLAMCSGRLQVLHIKITEFVFLNLFNWLKLVWTWFSTSWLNGRHATDVSMQTTWSYNLFNWLNLGILASSLICKPCRYMVWIIYCQTML
jgi:hypothetical protein